MSENQVLTINEMAKKLKVSNGWLYRKIRSGDIPSIRIGGVIRVMEQDLERWLSARMAERKSDN